MKGDSSAAAAPRRSKRTRHGSSTAAMKGASSTAAAPRRSKRTPHGSSTAAPLRPKAPRNPKSKNTPSFSNYDFFKALIERPLFSVPHYTEADLKPDSNILITLKKSATLSLPVNQFPRLRPPAVPRFILNLRMGGVIGRLKYREIGSKIDCLKMGRANFVKAIPPDVKFVEDIKSDALFILLVGNNSAFMELAEERFYDRFPCIILSAEGPPDFLYKLKMDLNLPVLALFDCDPYWFKMLSFYGRGLNDIKWLGIRPTDFDKYKMGERLTLPMSNKDIKTGKDLFKDHFVNQNPEWLLELKEEDWI
ncbi:hypothetical protein Leryth_020173 [Lithospermum erythrorhizon]|nr:hypothetical protein Leryth_020173 [Lithospermum erythrorhizon]